MLYIAFLIHAPDDSQVIYGSEPGSFHGGVGAPSRPPSRANSKSPMSHVVDMATSEYTTDTPSNRQEEEAHLQRAISESLHASGVQTPQRLPPPPPPPPPPSSQQSGVTSGGDAPVYFGPANRPDYDPNEWAMVPLRAAESDPEPKLRVRKPRAPVFLRCRQDQAWRKHRIGALLMIYFQIPAARNALLQSGDPPSYGYGNRSDWWKGQPILPAGQAESGNWECPPWSDELHRLMAFLEGTERSYGTADILARARYASGVNSFDAEKDFFNSFFELHATVGTHETMQVLTSFVEVVELENSTPQARDRFGLLDLQVSKDISPMPETLYDLLDFVFLADLRQAIEDPSSARMAWVAEASHVLTFRIQGDDGLPKPIEIPETFYIDRYMNVNGQKIQALQRDMMTVLRAYDANLQREKSAISWTNPHTNKVYDRRVISEAAVRRCREMIRRIKNRAFWREHEQAVAAGEEKYYLPEHTGEPKLLSDEAKVVAHYEAKIKELEEGLAEIERTLNGVLEPPASMIMYAFVR